MLHHRKASIYADVTVFKDRQDAVGMDESVRRAAHMTARRETNFEPHLLLD